MVIDKETGRGCAWEHHIKMTITGQLIADGIVGKNAFQQAPERWI